MDGKRSGRLLLVEDEHLLRGLVAQFLDAEGFDVVEAADGREAIALFSGKGPFDVILLDLNLPYVQGVEVCRVIKSRQPAQPFVVCSASLLDSHICELRALCVDQFLSKPYHPRDLLSCVRGEIDRARRLDSPSDPGFAAGPRRVVWRTDDRHSGPVAPHTLVNVPGLD
jgi:DNA-binding response OmpR family regulator